MTKRAYLGDLEEIVLLAVARCEPVYEDFPGWSESTFGVCKWEQLPANARQKYEQAIGRLDANGNGVPDLLESGVFGASGQATNTPAAPAPVPQPAPVFSDTLKEIGCVVV